MAMTRDEKRIRRKQLLAAIAEREAAMLNDDVLAGLRAELNAMVMPAPDPVCDPEGEIED